MKIALVSPYDFVCPGGVTNHITALGHHLALRGHDVRVIAPASSVVSAFDGRFIPIGKPRSIPITGSTVRISISLRLASEIKAVLARERFDIIHCHEPFMPMLCSAVLRFSNTATVGTFHACNGWPGYGFGRPIGTIMLRRRSSKLDGKIAVSKPAMEYARKYVSGYYNIIPNGIDLEHFSPDVSPIDEFCDGKANILFVGRLEGRKGLNYLLKAFKWVKNEIPQSRLIVVGQGVRMRKKYEKWVRRSQLEGVVFVGPVTNNELPRYYKTADIFCAPATGRESFGIVLLEAMAVGKPIVATSIDGYGSVLTNGAEGLLVPPKDEVGLARALLLLLSDRILQRQMGDKGRLKAQEYGWGRITQMVLTYYNKILGEHPMTEQCPEL